VKTCSRLQQVKSTLNSPIVSNRSYIMKACTL